MADEIRVGVLGQFSAKLQRHLASRFGRALDRVQRINSGAKVRLLVGFAEPAQSVVCAEIRRRRKEDPTCELELTAYGALSQQTYLRGLRPAGQKKLCQEALGEKWMTYRQLRKETRRDHADEAVARKIATSCNVLLILSRACHPRESGDTPLAWHIAAERKIPIIHVSLDSDGHGSREPAEAAGLVTLSGAGGLIGLENFPNEAPVFWLIRAQDSLQNSLGERNADERSLPQLQEDLSEILRWTFPNAIGIVVIDRIEGYSSPKGRHILQVEYFLDAKCDKTTCARVVKTGDAEKLRQELDGWCKAARPANDRGRVFMELRPGMRSIECPANYESLVYEDAYQTLRAADLTTLENAVRQSVMWGAPATSSIDDVLSQIFTEMCDRFYRRSWSSENPKDLTRIERAKLKNKIAAGSKAWSRPCKEKQAYEVRQDLLEVLPGKVTEFYDPVVLVQRALESGDLPEMRVGCVHGDLHGRNILLGVAGGRACWPAVFDYEDMRRDGLLAWDFVKLETELKKALFLEMFEGDEESFVERVYDVETRLDELTERNNNEARWRVAEGCDIKDLACGIAEDRLVRCFTILLSVRKWGKHCLESVHGRSRRWLHEYYFLLAAYGVYTAQFESLGRRDLAAIFTGASVAASRFTWASSRSLTDAGRAQGLAAIRARKPSARLPKDGHISHHAIYAFASEFARSRKKPFVERAIRILEKAQREFPHVLEIPQELALAHVEASSHFRKDGPKEEAEYHLEQAQRVLAEVKNRYRTEQVETLCRLGRIWKERGDEAFDKNLDYEEFYRGALSFYQRAYEISNDHYPGINAATLVFLLSGRDDTQDAEDRAAAIIEQLKDQRVDSGAAGMWVLATRAEAHLLKGECAEAVDLYRRAARHPASTPHAVTAMRTQIDRILKVRPCKEFSQQCRRALKW